MHESARLFREKITGGACSAYVILNRLMRRTRGTRRLALGAIALLTVLRALVLPEQLESHVGTRHHNYGGNYDSAREDERQPLLFSGQNSVLSRFARPERVRFLKPGLALQASHNRVVGGLHSATAGIARSAWCQSAHDTLQRNHVRLQV